MPKRNPPLPRVLSTHLPPHKISPLDLRKIPFLKKHPAWAFVCELGSVYLVYCDRPGDCKTPIHRLTGATFFDNSSTNFLYSSFLRLGPPGPSLSL